MATISESITGTSEGRKRQTGTFGEFGAFWRQFFVRAFDPYRPELHYMRGPGPACRAKQRGLPHTVRSMPVEIRTAEAFRSPTRP
jgi:hypothetical protein